MLSMKLEANADTHRINKTATNNFLSPALPIISPTALPISSIRPNSFSAYTRINFTWLA